MLLWIIPFCLMGAAPVRADDAPDLSQQGIQRADFPSFGISIQPPSGCQRIREERFEEIGRWIPPSRDMSAKPASVFSLLVYSIPEGEIEEIAKDFAETLKGKAEKSDLLIHKLPTWRIIVRGPKGVDTLYCCRMNRLIYVARYHSVLRLFHIREFKAFVESIRLLAEPKPPHLNLSMRNQTMTGEGADLVFDTFEPLRVITSVPDRASTTYAVQDYDEGEVALTLTVVTILRDAGTTWSAYGDQFAAQIARHYHLEKPPGFVEVKAQVQVLATGLLRGSTDVNQGEKRQTISRHILASGSNDKLVYLSFDINTKDEKAVQAYSTAIDRMIRTIRSDRNERQDIATRPADSKQP